MNRAPIFLVKTVLMLALSICLSAQAQTWIHKQVSDPMSDIVYEGYALPGTLMGTKREPLLTVVCRDKKITGANFQADGMYFRVDDLGSLWHPGGLLLVKIRYDNGKVSGTPDGFPLGTTQIVNVPRSVVKRILKAKHIVMEFFDAANDGEYAEFTIGTLPSGMSEACGLH